MRQRDDRILVSSATVDPGWSPPAGRVAGTAVWWGDEPWEVVHAERTADGLRWSLEPWVEGQPLRHTSRLDRETVGRWVAAERGRRATSSRRAGVVLLLPLVGFLPVHLQRRLESELGIRADRATRYSALLEILVGGWLAVQLLASVLGGVRLGIPALPPAIGWLAWAGPFLLAEGVLRLSREASDGEPHGTVLLWPLELLGDEGGPSRSPDVRRAPAGEPSLVGLIARYALGGFAPERTQRVVTERLGVPTVALTAGSALVETIGSAIDLTRIEDDPLFVVSLVVLCDGLLRLAAAVTGRPMGSLLGLPLLPLYRRWEREGERRS